MKTILVIGAGAIGGITAALLKKAGYSVEIVCKYPELAEKIQNTGLEVRGVKGSFFVKMPAFATIEEVQNVPDWVLLATKATDMMEAAHKLLPLLKPDSLVVSLQNGLCEDALAEVLGRERVIGCVVGWGATLLQPGVLEMASSGEFVIGNIDRKPDSRLPEIQKALSVVVPVEISEDIIASLYSKLIINSCITSLGAVCGLYLGEMLSRKKIRLLFVEIMREAMRVADAMNMKVPTYANKINYYTFLKSDSWWARLRRSVFIRLIGFKYRRLKSSSLQSLERGNRTEIDYLNGYICQNARIYGIPTPVNDWVVKTIHEIEEGKRPITEKNFEEIMSNRQ